MKLTYEPLGKYVRLVDERNADIVTETVLGINIDKYFMPSVANVIGTDLSNYKLLRYGRFACNPMHVGRDGRLPVARYTDEIPAIVSPAYFMFEIIDETIIEPEYLMLCFRRPDFDRMCWFRTDASVRGGISWEDVCALSIPVPSINEQRKIVHDYQVITDRIGLLRDIKEDLINVVMTSYFELLEHVTCISYTIGEIAERIAMGPFGSNIKVETFVPSGVPIISGNHLRDYFLDESSGYNYVTNDHANKLKNSIVKTGDIVFTHAGNIGQVALIPKEARYSSYVISQRQFFLRCNEKALPLIVLCFFHSPEGQRKLLSYANSTGVPSLSQPATNIKKIELKLPTIQEQNKWGQFIEPILDLYMNYHFQIEELVRLKEIMLCKMG